MVIKYTYSAASQTSIVSGLFTIFTQKTIAKMHTKITQTLTSYSTSLAHCEGLRLMNSSMCGGLRNHLLSPEVAVCTRVHVYVCAAKVSDIFLALQIKPQTHNSHHYLPDVHLRAHAHNSHTTHRSHFNPTMHKQPLEHFLTCPWTLITTL